MWYLFIYLECTCDSTTPLRCDSPTELSLPVVVVGRLPVPRVQLGLRAVQVSAQLAHQPRAVAVRGAQDGQRAEPALDRRRQLVGVRLGRVGSP